MAHGTVPPLLGSELAVSTSAFAELGGAVSADFLRQLCQTEDLSAVTQIELEVDVDQQPCESLGCELPALRELKLPRSFVPSIRALGTQLTKLRVLWLSRAGLSDLGGINALPVLEELYVSFNDVSDLSPLALHDQLQVLDLEGNCVADWAEVEHLQSCCGLRELTLTANPLRKKDPTAVLEGQGLEKAKYIGALKQLLPRLELLDDKLLALADEDESLSGGASLGGGLSYPDDFCAASDDEREHGTEREHTPAKSDPGKLADELSARWKHLTEPEEASTCSPSVEPAGCSSAGEPDEDDLVLEKLKAAARFGNASSSARPATSCGFGFRPMSRGATSAPPSFRPQTSYRPQTSMSVATKARIEKLFDSRLQDALASLDDDATASDLTTGCEDGIAGHPIHVVRLRRKNAPKPEDESIGKLDIRSLLARFETFAQPSCFSEQELMARRQAADLRPRTREGVGGVRIGKGRPLTSQRPLGVDEDPLEPCEKPVKVGNAELFVV